LPLAGAEASHEREATDLDAVSGSDESRPISGSSLYSRKRRPMWVGALALTIRECQIRDSEET
jgi:hypothetical protein